jgi:hypothetical protein
MLRRAIAGLLGAGVTFLARSVAPQISRSATISAAAFLCLGVGAGRAAPKPVPVKPTGHRPPPNAAARSGSTV